MDNNNYCRRCHGGGRKVEQLLPAYSTYYCRCYGTLLEKEIKEFEKNQEGAEVMNIAYIGVPAHGHTNPGLVVLSELQERGHQINMFNDERFRTKAEGAKIDLIAYPPLFPENEELKKSFSKLINATLLISTIAQNLTDFVLESLEQLKPDLVIYDSMAMWGYIAARKLKISNICFNTTFVMDGSEKTMGLRALTSLLFDGFRNASIILPWIKRMKDIYGNDCSGGITEFAKLNIVFTSREFHPPNKKLDSSFSLVGPAIKQSLRSGMESIKEIDLTSYSEKPLIYVSLGTIINDNDSFYKNILDIAGKIDAWFIISTGSEVNSFDSAAIPGNCHLFSYVPQLRVLEKANLFITHGGLNSIQESLYYGVPMIIFPGQIEQILNARQTQKQGVGIAHISKRSQSSKKQITRNIIKVLSNSGFKDRAEKIGNTLKNAGGYKSAADIIESAIGIKD